MGVDFSGAARSGETAWLAELDVTSAAVPLKLNNLQPLGRLAASDRREDVCRCLVDRIRQSESTWWGLDFPFGLPVELRLGGWRDQLQRVARHRGGAREFGLELVRRSQQRTGALHVRRRTDRETQTPFDCYHYRIIYQTFHGMRDVLRPLAEEATAAVLPFQYPTLSGAATLVTEACPSSTLKRLQLPHRRYKQTGRRPPEPTHRRTRQAILRGISQRVEISPYRRRVILRDPGGDALDAVLAAVGCWLGIRSADHAAIASDPRYPREGFVYC